MSCFILRAQNWGEMLQVWDPSSSLASSFQACGARQLRADIQGLSSSGAVKRQALPLGIIPCHPDCHGLTCHCSRKSLGWVCGQRGEGKIPFFPLQFPCHGEVRGHFHVALASESFKQLQAGGKYPLLNHKLFLASAPLKKSCKKSDSFTA